MFRKSLIAGAILAGASSTVLAVPFMAQDARTLGMGGAAVSSATGNNASLYNPALLSTAAPDEDFALQVPIGLRVADPDDLQTAVDDFETNGYYTNYETAYNNMVAAPSGASIAAYDQATKDLVKGLQTLSGKDVELDVNGNLVIAIPSRNFAGAFTAGMWSSGGFQGEFTDNDANTMSNIVSEILANPTNLPASALDPASMSSNIKVRGIVARELGVSLAKEYNVFGQDIAFGITPKMVQVNTYDVLQDMSSPAIELKDGEKSSSGFTMDFGMARDYGNYWKTGFVVKNLIPQSYDTALGNKIEVNPAARVGVSRTTDRTAIALDIDLTENSSTSFGNETQYVSLGGELDLWLLELRAGYRHNIPNDKTSVMTAGVGLYLFGLNIDVAGAMSPSGNEYGASAQVGFSF